MKTWRYHKDYPLGKVFNTEPYQPEPLVPPRSSGWVEDRAELQMTTDQFIESIVKEELAKQSSDRILAEKELRKKTRMEQGIDRRPSSLVPDKKIIDALDNK